MSAGKAPIIKKGAWEWNVARAAKRRSEADRLFQQRISQAYDSSKVNNDVETGDVAEGETAMDANEAISKSEEVNVETVRSEEETPNYSLRHRHLPPHKRPKKSQLDYRISALEHDHDEGLIPCSEVDDMAWALPAALERERLHEVSVPALLRKRIWNYQGLDYSKAHPKEQCAGGLSTITPDSWGGDEDEKEKPWPHGTPYDAEVFTLCWNFFLFLYKKYKRASIKIVLLQIVVSFESAICSYLFGTGLLDELNKKTSVGQTEKQRTIRSCSYIFAICFLRIFASYLTVYYKGIFPSGAARTNLRDTLFHRMMNLQSPLKDKLTPGAASGIIVDKVQSAVGIYDSFLTFPGLVSGILANLAVSLSSLVNIQYSHLVYLPTIFVIIMAVTVPILANLWFQPEYCILTRLEHQWMIRLRSIAGSAIPRNGRSYNATFHDDEESQLCTDKEDEEESGITRDDSMRQVFHETAYLQTMRHWQSWKFSAVILFLISISSQIMIAIVTITAGYSVIWNKGLTVGGFTTLITSVSSIVSLGGYVGSFLTGLYESHMMLKQITCIMNDEDIAFDGGTDHFKTIEMLELKVPRVRMSNLSSHTYTTKSI